MSKMIRCERMRLGRLLPVCGLAIGIAACSGSGARAQIVPDATLPLNSDVTQSGSEIEINGGTQAGSHLFHSFEEFSLPAGGTAFFNNSLEIENIFTRVTGGSISNIDGTLRANGTANLFLLNPNGIIFGPNARLAIGGSFLGTTASSINFADGTFFSATGEQSTPLLTVSVPVGLQFGEAPGAIIARGVDSGNSGSPPETERFRKDRRIESVSPEEISLPIRNAVANLGFTLLRGRDTGLQVRPKKTLAFVGGDIVLQGAQLGGQLGRIELGSVAGNNLVSLTPVKEGWALGYEEIRDFRDVTLSRASVGLSGFGSNDIQVRGRRVVLIEGSSLASFAFENIDDGGEIFIGAERLNIEDDSLLGTVVFSERGRGGNATIETEVITVLNSGILSANARQDNAGKAGNIMIIATEFVELIGQQQGGALPGGLIAATTNAGAGGTVKIETRQLTARDGAGISVSAFDSGAGGTAEVVASELIEVSGESENVRFPSGLTAESFGTGAAGSLRIDTSRLVVRDGATISVAARSGSQGGTVNVKATESIDLIGTTTDNRFESGIAAFAIGRENTGDLRGGDVHIETGRLTVRDGAQISASGFGTGEGGTVTVNASESIELIGVSEVGPEGQQYNSGLLAEARLFSNNETIDRNRSAGNLVVSTPKLIVRDRAEITASGQGDGAAGNLNIAADSIRLGSRGAITATTETGDRANISIQTGDLQLRRNSSISTSATRNATGGNITIDTDTLVALENSDITAQAVEGDGGNIQINTQGDFRSFDSDIDASSRLGIDGLVAIKRPEIDPSFGLVGLPEKAIAVEDSIAPGCSQNNSPESSYFINTGLGGIPENPGEMLVGDAFLDDLRLPEELAVGEIASPLPNPDVRAEISEPILEEAQGWRRNEKGEIVLVAESSAGSVNSSWRSAVGCDGQVSSLLHYKDGSEQRFGRGERPFAPTTALTSLPAPANKANTAPQTFTVERFEFAGNTAFSSEELAKVTKPFANRSLSFEELIQARAAVTQLYIEAGYATSGALIPPQTANDGTVEIKVVEGRLEDIEVEVSGRLDPNYIRDRLARGNREILNINNLVSALQLLKLDDGLVENISAELSALPRPGRNRLEVRVEESPPFRSQFSIDNRRSPSVGSFRRQARLHQTNLLGIGDRLSLGYSNTDGSNSWDLGYSLPINSRNGTVSFAYSNGNSEIIEAPFDDLDIQASSRSYELSLRQPIIQTVKKDGRIREVALGLRASRQESTTTLLGERFPLSPGADANGETDVSALRFFQEWTERDSQQVLAARSEFSLGVGALDGDSIFFGWRGQGQWARRLGKNSMLLLKGDAQLSPNALASSEQFGVGGLDSVRGYRQDTLLADNGVLASAELRLPVYRLPKRAGVVQIAPFVDLGAGWNSDRRDNPAANVLLSAGLGLRFQLGDKLSARFDWGIPLIDVDSRNKTWQENGLYFSLDFNPF